MILDADEAAVHLRELAMAFDLRDDESNARAALLRDAVALRDRPAPAGLAETQARLNDYVAVAHAAIELVARGVPFRPSKRPPVSRT